MQRRAFLRLASGVVLAAAAAPELVTDPRRFWPGYSAVRDGDPVLIARMAIQREIDQVLAQRRLLEMPVRIRWVDSSGEGLLEDLPGPITIKSSFVGVRPQLLTSFPLPPNATAALVYAPSYRRDFNGRMIEDYHLLGRFGAEQLQDIGQGEAAREQWNQRMLEQDIRWAEYEDALSLVERLDDA